MESDSMDAIVCDPPYELSNDGKASPYRVFAEFMFPQDAKINPMLGSEDELPFLVNEVLQLRGIGVVPTPATPVPVSSVTLDDEASHGDEDIKNACECAIPSTNTDLSEKVESESAKYLGCFAFELADFGSLCQTLDCVGAGFISGGLGIGFRISPASAPSLLGCCDAIYNSDHGVGGRDDALTQLVGMLSRAEHVPVTRLHLTRGSLECFATDSALVFLAVFLLSGAKLVRADAAASRLPSMLETRRIRVVDAMTNRALTFDLVLHPTTITSFGFMGKEWDGQKVAFNVDLWKEALRVAKPGAYLLAFGGTRMVHRLACAIEDAGWEIRDTIAYMYGVGFPKSLDVSKAIDRELGVPQEVSGKGQAVDRIALDYGGATGKAKNGLKSEFSTSSECNTDAASQWVGWGTALKPAHEPIILARKPLIGTVAANVLAHGTGGINIDGCRIAGSVPSVTGQGFKTGKYGGQIGRGDPTLTGQAWEGNKDGRWPANVVLGCACETPHEPDCAVALLDAQTGTLGSSYRPDRAPLKSMGFYGGNGEAVRDGFDDVGGASRFFYCAKASRSERTHGGQVVNLHPTVKPISLMRWLCRLVTPPGGTVLDPFTGSGSTGVAAILEGFLFVGCEKESESVETSRSRLEMATLVATGGVKNPWEDDPREPTTVKDTLPISSIEDLFGFGDA
jgi:site-specific DNA-methyltransferase (adenine-specific)